MQTTLAEHIVREFEQGALSRRELVARLTGLGAAMAASQAALGADASDGESVFQATGLDHVALNVSDVAKSREFYIEHLGLKVLGGQGQRHAFLGLPDNNEFFMALFPGDSPGLNHHAYAIRNYDPDRVVQKLKAAGLDPTREQDRVYFKDPDGITVQVTHA